MGYVFVFLDSASPLIPLLWLLQYRSKALFKSLLLLFLYLLAQFVFNTLADVLSYYPQPNYFVYHLNLLYSFFALLLFFHHSGKHVFFTTTYFIIGAVLVVFFCINSLFFETIGTFNSISYCLCSFFVLMVCLRFFWMKVTTNDASDILKQPYFWFISGLFIYYCSCFIVFFYYKVFIASNNQLAYIVWRFQSVMHLLMCLFLTKGIQQKRLCLTK